MTRQKLRNPNIFVSPTRLCVRNIPVSVTDSRLKKIFLAAAENQKAKVTEVCLLVNLFYCSHIIIITALLSFHQLYNDCLLAVPWTINVLNFARFTLVPIL